MPPDGRAVGAQPANHTVTVRPFRGSDRAACAWLFETVQREIFPRDDPTSFARERFDASTAGEAIWVAEAAGCVVGFVTLWRPEPFVHYLLVDAVWRGHGIGRQLLAPVLACVGGAVDLKCRADNAAARRFYRREGWREVGHGRQDGAAYIRYRKEPAASAWR